MKARVEGNELLRCNWRDEGLDKKVRLKKEKAVGWLSLSYRMQLKYGRSDIKYEIALVEIECKQTRPVTWAGWISPALGKPIKGVN